MEEIKVEEIINYLNREYGVKVIDKEDFKDGSGVYGIFFGSRDYIEEIFKVEGKLVLKSKEELVNNMLGFYEGDENDREYYEEFCDSGEVEFCNNGWVYNGLIEVLNEEESIEYYNVVVK